MLVETAGISQKNKEKSSGKTKSCAFILLQGILLTEKIVLEKKIGTFHCVIH